MLARKQIWLACTPKSASTYLDKLLTHLFDGEIARNPPVSYWRGRFQEPEIVKFYEGIRFNRKPFFSGHLHVKYSQFIYSQFLRRQADSIPNNRGGVIVLTRNLGDTIVSLTEYLEREFQRIGHLPIPWLTGFDEDWPSLSEDERYRLVADAYAFWHLDFERSWQGYPFALQLTYEDVVTNTAPSLQQICDYLSITKSKADIKESIEKIGSQDRSTFKYNVGLSGRGTQKLPSDVQNYCDDLKNRYGVRNAEREA